MREFVLCPVFIPVASALVAQQDLVVALRSVAMVAIFSPNPRFWGFLFVVGVFSCLRLDSLAALVVLPFSSVCLSYAWDVACGGWSCGFSLRASSLVVPAWLCGCFVMRWSCVFHLSSCSVPG